MGIVLCVNITENLKTTLWKQNSMETELYGKKFRSLKARETDLPVLTFISYKVKGNGIIDEKNKDYLHSGACLQKPGNDKEAF